jgi:hypothetical protein
MKHVQTPSTCRTWQLLSQESTCSNSTPAEVAWPESSYEWQWSRCEAMAALQQTMCSEHDSERQCMRAVKGAGWIKESLFAPRS